MQSKNELQSILQESLVEYHSMSINTLEQVVRKALLKWNIIDEMEKHSIELYLKGRCLSAKSFSIMPCGFCDYYATRPYVGVCIYCIVEKPCREMQNLKSVRDRINLALTTLHRLEQALL